MAEEVEGRQRALSGVEDGSIRERILTEAARLFADKGYAATSVREITQAAGATGFRPLVEDTKSVEPCARLTCV